LGALEPFREQVQAIAVESTFNWYWLVDGLMEAGYQVQRVNTSAVRQYERLKYVDDRHDARWLARLLHLGILPTGHIYPRGDHKRATRASACGSIRRFSKWPADASRGGWRPVKLFRNRTSSAPIRLLAADNLLS
jgi:hypothetical protein